MAKFKIDQQVSVRNLIFCLTISLMAFSAGEANAKTIIPSGRSTAWRYLDTSVEPASDWFTPEFDDSQWKSGPAPLGFGESSITTQVQSGPDSSNRPITTWFRHAFDQPDLKPGEKLVLQFCVDDGAIIYLNGTEVGRFNLPDGPIKAETLASKPLSDHDEGFYQRMIIPTDNLKLQNKNQLCVEVHQCSAASSDLFFDLTLKTIPTTQPAKVGSPEAAAIIQQFNQQHLIGPDIKIPDGYIDGGRGMTIAPQGDAASGREILKVDRTQDPSLAEHLAFARSPEITSLPPQERIQRIAARIDAETTPPGGIRWVEETTDQLQSEFENQPILIGDWVNQCQAGVCRHRALLFKIIADEAGLKASLVRGNYAGHGAPGDPHAWNEILLPDGQRILVDVMHHRGKPEFRSVTDPRVSAQYLKVDDTPWYSSKNP